MKVGVITFPGSNCDQDCHRAISLLGHDSVTLWHQDRELQGVEAVIVPGGFSYGDYLRCGAIARFSPVMDSVKRFADEGRPVLGICNGFQILTEAGLLPGALLRNASLKFVCKPVTLSVVSTRTPFTRGAKAGQKLNLPVAHGDGNFFADAETLAELERNQQVVFRYDGDNPNGSLANIAGICNARGNVVGMMPHPERHCEEILGGTDGRMLFSSLFGVQS